MVRSSRTSKTNKVLKILVSSLLIIGLGMLVPWLYSAVSAVVLKPVYTFNNWLETSTSIFPSYLRDRQDLISQINELENKVLVARGTDLTLSRLRDENLRLRSLLHATDNERIAAAVIARPNDLPYDLIQIDQGSRAGVAVGAPVYIGADRVIGFVSLVTQNHSFVELITTTGFEATAYIEGADVIATIEGVGGGVARVKVAQGVALREDQLVYLPSIHPGVFGRIAYVENRPTQPEQYGYIAPEISIQSLYFVGVSKHPVEKRDPREIEIYINEELRQKVLIKDLDESSTSSAESATTTLDS